MSARSGDEGRHAKGEHKVVLLTVGEYGRGLCGSRLWPDRMRLKQREENNKMNAEYRDCAAI